MLPKREAARQVKSQVLSRMAMISSGTGATPRPTWEISGVPVGQFNLVNRQIVELVIYSTVTNRRVNGWKAFLIGVCVCAL